MVVNVVMEVCVFVYIKVSKILYMYEAIETWISNICVAPLKWYLYT